jgi:hypothetical protein
MQVWQRARASSRLAGFAGFSYPLLKTTLLLDGESLVQERGNLLH